MSDRPWQKFGSTMPVGDHRGIVREYRGANGEVAMGYWTGRELALAPVTPIPEPLPFSPVEERLPPEAVEEAPKAASGGDDRMKPVEDYIATLSWTGDASDHDMALVAGNLRAFFFTMLAQGWSQWPAELVDDDLRDALGTICYQIIHEVGLYRAAGFEIPSRAEAEQAFMIHRFVRAWIARGSEWRAAIGEEMRQLLEQIEARAQKDVGA